MGVDRCFLLKYGGPSLIVLRAMESVDIEDIIRRIEMNKNASNRTSGTGIDHRALLQMWQADLAP